MNRSDFVTVHVDPNDLHFKFSKGIVINTRQVGSKKTATADVVYYLEKFTQSGTWIPVLMSTGNPQHLIDHINQVYKASSPKPSTDSIVDQINNSVDDLEEKLKEIMGDLENVNSESDENAPQWQDQYEELKKQIEELKKGTKELETSNSDSANEEDKPKAQQKPKK